MAGVLTENLIASSPVTINGFKAVVLDGYEKGMRTGDGPWRKVRYLTDWADSDAFIDALFGVGTVTYPVPGTPWTPPLPHAYPGNPNIVALDAVCQPIGAVEPDEAKLFASRFAQIDVTYGTPAFDVYGQQPEMAFGGQPERWSRDEIRSFMEGVRVPAATLVRKGEDGTVEGDTLEKDFEIQVPHLELRRTTMFVPYLSLPTLTALQLKLNADWFWGFAPGTLRFEPFDLGVETDMTGRKVGTLVRALTWRPYDWNMVPRADGPGWEYIGYPGSAAAPYQYADFTQAFRLMGA